MTSVAVDCRNPEKKPKLQTFWAKLGLTTFGDRLLMVNKSTRQQVMNLLRIGKLLREEDKRAKRLSGLFKGGPQNGVMVHLWDVCRFTTQEKR